MLRLISFRVATQNVMEDMNEESLPKASFSTDHFRRRRSIFSSTITATGTNASSLESPSSALHAANSILKRGGDDDVGERSLNVEVEEWRHSLRATALHSIERRASKTGLAMARAAAASGRFHFEDTECRIGPLARLVRNAFEIAIKKYKLKPNAVLVRLMRASHLMCG